MRETILTNAQLVLENEIVRGAIVFDEHGIKAVDQGASAIPGAIDAEGDYVCPGLIEVHTDNLEKHFMPRPGVFWPDGLAAALAHDNDLAGAGITTVYDSVSAGTPYGKKEYRRSIFGHTIDAISSGVQQGLFRIDHLLHIRCELSGAMLIDDIAPYMDHPLFKLVSVMDHTPGQRQWRNLGDLKRYNRISRIETDEEFDAAVREEMEAGPVNVARNWPRLAEMLKGKSIPLATHDDTTEADAQTAHDMGAVISEFPTTIEAARAAHTLGIATLAGAPNVVRGGSHSGGVSASDLAGRGILDGLSSDYVPASLLQAILKLDSDAGVPLHQALAMATWKIADIVGLSDRGHLKPGLRADLLRFRVIGKTPVLRGLWLRGCAIR
jgi:alpha-D-ribose 1-methylphosphonate 5-triphosphate diphosphatase